VDLPAHVPKKPVMFAMAGFFIFRPGNHRYFDNRGIHCRFTQGKDSASSLTGLRQGSPIRRDRSWRRQGNFHGSGQPVITSVATSLHLTRIRTPNTFEHVFIHRIVGVNLIKRMSVISPTMPHGRKRGKHEFTS
jgi:hypothetical protein